MKAVATNIKDRSLPALKEGVAATAVFSRLRLAFTFLWFRVLGIFQRRSLLSFLFRFTTCHPLSIFNLQHTTTAYKNPLTIISRISKTNNHNVCPRSRLLAPFLNGHPSTTRDSLHRRCRKRTSHNVCLSTPSRSSKFQLLIWGLVSAAQPHGC